MSAAGSCRLHRLQSFPDLAMIAMEKVETMSIELCALNYPKGTCFGGPTWLHRLQRFPNLALNPMMVVVTMVTMFFDHPKNLLEL